MVWSILLLAASAPILSLARDEINGRQDPQDLIAPLRAIPFKQPCGSDFIPKIGTRGKRQDPLEYFIPALSSLCEDAILHDDSKSKRTRRFVKEVIPFLADNYQGPTPSFSALPVPGAGNPSTLTQQQRPSSQSQTSAFPTINNQGGSNSQINPNLSRPQFNQRPKNPRPSQILQPTLSAITSFGFNNPQTTFNLPSNQFQSFQSFQNQGQNNRNFAFRNQELGFNGFQ